MGTGTIDGAVDTFRVVVCEGRDRGHTHTHMPPLLFSPRGWIAICLPFTYISRATAAACQRVRGDLRGSWASRGWRGIYYGERTVCRRVPLWIKNGSLVRFNEASHITNFWLKLMRMIYRKTWSNLLPLLINPKPRFPPPAPQTRNGRVGKKTKREHSTTQRRLAGRQAGGWGICETDERVRTLISIGNAAETREKAYVLVDGVWARCPVGQSRAIEPAISGNQRVIPKSWYCCCCCCCWCWLRRRRQRSFCTRNWLGLRSRWMGEKFKGRWWWLGFPGTWGKLTYLPNNRRKTFIQYLFKIFIYRS